jgi:hypothetical protein
LKNIRQQSRRASRWPGQADFQKLLRNSVPLFIFAVTVCDFIENYQQAGGIDSRLQKVLQHESRGDIDETYRLILDYTVHTLRPRERNDAVGEFKKIVGSIVTLASPLRTTSIACLLGIDLECVSNRLKPLHSILDIPREDHSPVRIFHESFRDFLIHPDPEKIHEFCVDEKATHKMLADRCLALLSHGGHLKQDICGLEAPGCLRTILDKPKIDRCLPSHVQYACLYWVHHLKKSEVKLDDHHQVLSFFLDHFLHWLEALSLMGMISEGIRLLNELQGLVDVSLCWWL